MTPERLVRSAGGLERRLLQAAQSESPAHGAQDRAMAALDLARRGAALGPSARVTRASAGAVCGAAVALVLGALGTLGIHELGARPAASILTPSIPARSPAPVVAAGVQPPLAVSPGAADRLAATASTAPPARSWHAAGEPGSDLGIEVALVQQATHALADHDGDAALNALDRYGAKCPRRILGEEASVLRVRALMMVGRVSEGRALARRVRDADPHGALARQLDAVLEVRTIP